jgi:TetR/AcrR family transcriptional repressor of nem operon
MSYPPDHKARTHERIVTSARRLFNARGFSDVSIDEIMEAAGLTRGGFYHHFKSKDDLYVEAVKEVMHHPPAPAWGLSFDPAAPAPTFARQMIEAYLSPHHLTDCDVQCPMVALPSDIARAGPQVRAAFEQVLGVMRDVILRGIGGRAQDERALAIAALCVGGMVLARTVNDPSFAEAIRNAALAAALELGGLQSPTTGDLS